MARWYPPRIRRARAVAHDNALQGLPCPAWKTQLPPQSAARETTMIVAGCTSVRLHGNGVIEITGDLTVEGKI
ncbi:hypothetical protein D3W54_07010 [Komagataeibacter medellinensis]|uniref:Polymer-forming cytoskeletal protein n=1 Tax=Komagataeibacter medellinensis TaxID=1177712 RepID=A0ABQ6VV45_9PROT|nr:hypothetical protein [Komagataeibacter medellinensis]KAB8123991.1 hypothetical protein D3W54_07010 [Komagataeibacter medellinensis]